MEMTSGQSDDEGKRRLCSMSGSDDVAYCASASSELLCEPPGSAGSGTSI